MAGATVTAIQKAGVVGAGGGGFPTHVKAGASADIVLANGAECEPLLRADTELMLLDPERVVRGLAIVRDSVGAARAVIALKKKNTRALEAITGALPRDGRVELLPLSNVYPAGDEFLLVFEATGRVVPEGGIPLDVGVVVSNVTTLAQVADAVEGRPVIERMVTVQGEVAEPATFVAPIGTPVEELIAGAGGATCSDRAVVDRRPDDGTPMAGGGEPTTKTVAGVIVLPADHQLVGSMSARESPCAPARPSGVLPVHGLHRTLPAGAPGPRSRASPDGAGHTVPRRSRRTTGTSLPPTSVASAACASCSRVRSAFSRDGYWRTSRRNSSGGASRTRTRERTCRPTTCESTDRYRRRA